MKCGNCNEEIVGMSFEHILSMSRKVLCKDCHNKFIDEQIEKSEVYKDATRTRVG
jgi:hypothetical protein